MEQFKVFLALLAEVENPPRIRDSAEELILKTLSRILERDLAALLVGAAVMLVVLVKYWDIPKKWDSTHERLSRIEKRQKKFYPLFLQYIGAAKYIDHDDFEEEEEGGFGND
jgi:hypothetical protein